MTERNRRMVHEQTVADQPVFISESTELEPGSQMVITDSSSAAVEVTLPNLSESFMNIIAVEAEHGNDNDVSVLEKEGGTEVTGGDLDAANDIGVFMNIGRRWVPLYTTEA